VETESLYVDVAALKDAEPAPGGELGALLRLAAPVVLVQVGLMAMGMVDTIMVGHLSATALAAVALGNIYFFGLSMFGMGTLMSLDPVVAQAVGARDGPAVVRAIQRGVLIALALSAVMSLLLLAAGPFFRFLGQPRDVVPVSAAFCHVSIPGAFPFLAFIVLRQSLQAMRRMIPIVITVLVANAANAALNWVLIYGHLGSPPLGVVGSAWSTSVSRWLMAGGLLAFAWRDLRALLLPWRREAFQLLPLKRMVLLGAPVGIQQQLEFGAFAVIALLMGWMGTTAMASHQVAINLAAFTFMVPLGISAAAAVLVGHAVGRGDAGGAQRSAVAALASGGGVMCVSAAVFLALPSGLAHLYTNDRAVIALSAALIPIAGIFQVFDGLQVVAAGVLRGVGDTRAPMVVNLLGFWLIGMPVSLYLGFRAGAGPVGLWWGLVAGLAAVAVFLLVRVRMRFGRELRRVVIDEHADARGRRLA
jgi:multidrug resistance protein, MATE family